jgi:TPR repeat protein
MNQVARQKLAQLVGRYGRDVAGDPRRCEALLRDVCPQHKREIFVLVSAVKESVPAELLGSASGMPQEVLLSRLSKRLHDNLGLDEALTRWAVESWACALGIISTEETTMVAAAEIVTVGAPSADDDIFSDFPRTSAEDILRQTIRRVLEDGIVTDEERAEVQKLCRELGVPRDMASRVLNEVKAEMGIDQPQSRTAPSLGKDRPATSSSTAPVQYRAVDLTEVLLEPASYSGQPVRIEGVYASLYTGDESFKLEQGDHEIWVFYSKVSRDQKSVILRESEAEGRNVVVEGVLKTGNGDLKLRAASVVIDGMQPKAPARSADGSVQLTEILLDPTAFRGQQVRIRGKYASLYTGDESFKLEQGDHEIWVFYSQLPRDQKALILRESEAEGQSIVVDGELKAKRGDIKMVASRIAFEATVHAAIAYSPSTGGIAYSYGCTDQETAQRLAIEQCQTVDAEAVVWVRDGYCAIAIAQNGARGWGWGDTADAAARAACEGCSEHSLGHEIVVQVVSAREGQVEGDESAEGSGSTPVQADQTTVTNSTAESVLAAPGRRSSESEVVSGQAGFPATVAPTPPPVPAVCTDWITEQCLSDIVWNLACPRIEELKARFATRTAASPTQIENIRSACHIALGEPILALIDVTIRKNGMNGVCFTPNGIYWHYKFMGIGLGHGFLGYDQVAQEPFDPKGTDEIVTRRGVITMSTYAQARDPTIIFLRTLRDRIINSATIKTASDRPTTSGSPSPTLTAQVAADIASALKADRSAVGLKSFVEKIAANRVVAWRQAAEAGVPGAQWLFGFCLFEGIGVPQNHADAVKWVRRAAEQGFAAGQAALASCYYGGQGLSQDSSEAFKWACKAAEQGDADGQFFLGLCYVNGRGVAQDQGEAVKWFHMAADQGNPNGQNWLGLCCANGGGVPQNHAEAVKWYRTAADQGHSAGQVNLGTCYQAGQGISQDNAEAAKWFHKAAEQGDADGQNLLGVCYENGQGVVQNDADAATWYRRSADQGHPLGQTNLGGCYRDGRGVTQSDAEALKWFHASAEKGEPIAQCALADYYAAGQGVQQDYAEAAKWYRKSAEQGFAGAQFGLGLCYQNGLGVSQDSGEAAKWLRSAAEQGHREAQDALRQVEKSRPAEIVRSKCPACGRGLKVGTKLAGQVLPCPACRTNLCVSADLQLACEPHIELVPMDDIVLNAPLDLNENDILPEGSPVVQESEVSTGAGAVAQCRVCGHQFEIESRFAGLRTSCPSCGTAFNVGWDLTIF